MFGVFFRKPASAEERRIRAWCRKTLGVTPKDLPLYRQALRHRSALSDDRPDLADNERLEFLGDAVLDAIMGEYLYHRYPDQGEGFLTRMRSKLVSRHQLSILAKRVEIERVMEVNIGGGQDTSVPGNAMEALFGALLMDRGFDRTKQVVVRLFTTYFDISAVEQEDRDSKSRLLEWGQKQHRRVEFVIAANEGAGGRSQQFTAEARVDGETKGTGSGHSKKKAEQEAAHDAMRRMGLSTNGGNHATRRRRPERGRPQPRGKGRDRAGQQARRADGA